MHVRVGTRRSDLARWQANHVAQLIKLVEPTAKVSMFHIGSVGDRDRKSGFQVIGGIGVFTKESEEAISRGDCDLVVHSLKDLPTTLAAGLVLAAVPKREDPRDCLCGVALKDLKPGIRIGTGSIRRKAQLLAICSELDIRPIRGNVPPRLRKAKNKEGIDGTVLSAAGLQRLGIINEATDILPAEIFPYAVGQGALGIEARSEDTALLRVLQKLDDRCSRAEVTSERKLLHTLEAGCSLPVGVHCVWESDTQFSLRAQVTSVNGSKVIEFKQSGSTSDAEGLGDDVAKRLIEMGAEAILAEVSQAEPNVLTDPEREVQI